ncbi:MAG: HAMP domain-containing histidine kinase [Oscillospiraceae bacterium]|nr:HAMP domain-containing histidine kinase [Oscillospiraceae bacterium]
MNLRGSIATRWFVNSFAVVAAILVVMTIAVFFMLRWYYYGAVSQILQSEANMIARVLSNHHDEYGVIDSNIIRTTVENFENKNLMELMALGAGGEVLLTSSGFSPESAGGIVAGSRESYMEVIAPLPTVPESRYSAIRLVTSMTAVDNQVYTFTLYTGIFSLATLLVLLSLGLYFIRSIVSPLRQIGDTAKRLADGDFSVRMAQTKNADEIGELCSVFNDMADELETSELLKHDFISSVSHELRTPLTAIKGWSETVLELRDDEALVEKGMNIISAEADRLTEMVEELLDFSRIQSGQLSLQMAEFNITAELTSAVTIYTERAVREGITLTLRNEDEFAPVFGDKNRLRQVFLNIIDNAIKYSGDSGDDKEKVVRISSKIGSALDGSPTAVIAVSDAGCGIAKAELAKVKLKFYKANNTRRGSGIGLAVADEIVSLHSGRLDIKSELGVGTTVKITLPLIKGDLAEDNYTQEVAA